MNVGKFLKELKDKEANTVAPVVAAASVPSGDRDVDLHLASLLNNGADDEDEEESASSDGDDIVPKSSGFAVARRPLLQRKMGSKSQRTGGRDLVLSGGGDEEEPAAPTPVIPTSSGSTALPTRVRFVTHKPPPRRKGPILTPSTAPSGLEVLLGETVRNIEVSVSAEQPSAVSEPSVDADWEDISTFAMVAIPTTTTTAPASTPAVPANLEREEVDNWDDL